MAKRNSVVYQALRISGDVDDFIKEMSEELCFSKNDVLRLLLNRSVLQIKGDLIRFGGWKNLSFEIKPN